MPRTKLGKTGIEVSRLGFGSHLESSLIKKPRRRDRIIKMGFEGGINTFDVYDHGGYKQFEPMSKSLRDIRKEVIISLYAVNPTDKLQDEIDGALKTFRTDYIDLYRINRVDDDRISILEKSKKAGKIRAIGVVSHDATSMTGYVEDYRDILDFVMIVYNFHHNIGRFTRKIDLPNDYSALIPMCEQIGLGILGIKPMGSDDMTAFASKKGFFNDKKANLAQAMLRHIYRRTEIDCVMPAMNSMHELSENLESIYNPVSSPDEKELLERLSAHASSTRGAYLRPHYRWLENWSTRTV
ncbi:MAG: hypothetical protein HOC71_16100 [Candidatus Latescibacteria bacterium]|nr:hypothetical protein [Candidatus Latescibacterota bacterium]